MRNLFAKLLVFTLFVVVAGTMQGIAQPQALDDPPQCFIQDGTGVAEIVFTVDDLQGEEHLYASLSSDPQYELEDPPAIEEGESLADYAKRNWKWLATVLILLLEFIVRLTPTEKDNSILARFLGIFGAIVPNLKKGGGTHTPST